MIGAFGRHEQREFAGPGRPRNQRRRHGFSYLEVLVATLLVALALSPAIEGLAVGLLGTRVHLELAQDDAALRTCFEQTLARSFTSLDAEALAVASPTVATAFSDGAGSDPRCLVYLSRYDGTAASGGADPFTVTDTDLLWARVELENGARALETLTAP